MDVSDIVIHWVVDIKLGDWSGKHHCNVARDGTQLAGSEGEDEPMDVSDIVIHWVVDV